MMILWKILVVEVSNNGSIVVPLLILYLLLISKGFSWQVKKYSIRSFFRTNSCQLFVWRISGSKFLEESFYWVAGNFVSYLRLGLASFISRWHTRLTGQQCSLKLILICRLKRLCLIDFSMALLVSQNEITPFIKYTKVAASSYVRRTDLKFFMKLPLRDV